MKRVQFYRLLVFIGVALAVLAGGFYIGGKYGFDIFKSQARKQAEVAAIEADLNMGLNEGRIANTTGRIKSMDTKTGSLVLLDQTLGTVYKAPGGFVERTILIDARTTLVKEESSGGPHFVIGIGELRPGQSVAAYLAKNDFSENNALAKEVVLYEYIPAYTPSAPTLAGQGL